MSKFDDIKIPNNIDEVTKKAIARGKNYTRRKKQKKIMIASATIIIIGTGIIGVGIKNPSIADSISIIKNILNYFYDNKESLYESDKKDLEKTGVDLNLTVEDKGIEFTINSISVDDNYITIFHTVKTDKNIKEIDKSYKEAYFANPIERLYIDGKDVIEGEIIEQEATYMSDNELKGMRKIDVSNVEIPNNTEIELRVDEIFGVKGNWSIFTKIDKSNAIAETYNYNINKDFIVKNTYDYKEEKIDINHKINIEKVIISPLASKIVINEKSTKTFDDWSSMLGNSFALFDQDGKSLDVVDKGGFGFDHRGIATNSYEFLKADKNTKSLTLVPISYDETIENYDLEPQSIDKLPIVFETSEYGKLIVEDIQITDEQIKYTYYKEGVVPYYANLWFYDEDGKELQIGYKVKEKLDRSTGRYTKILDIYQEDIEDIKNIKKISTFSNSDMKLLYDQQIKIDLLKYKNK
ncbi:DUF4179 domain-containing protein [Romboutsia sp. 1001216sp1]|uniref:DUF4179 domain-containing protein n=1 Tax=Romboutsia TaxID=1501226 RepID=UPI000B8413D1|nr:MULTISPECIES: DUF4179 domain-containing protein [Romboutsia]MDB8794178.1 DUF4179 domain-containing protein [Romboutsia sp. 1001216sp1]MDB8797207.1 DUF4179 domain-containing protein [Romboutsia sp. 1001216sp1]MDB8800005.1 DUF4179 domain-containing protein [Romboutsia sp. 1001216sp1]